ncbi:mpv17-like protein 2 [Hydra vulgaris]|uniref:mpv17-like protein 2 n=1 Tax=Hydra vulgaris TaxID=6087 RepID=UPI001F5E7128|nr:mpv17-like protein 2 [Hydra vulgaris]
MFFYSKTISLVRCLKRFPYRTSIHQNFVSVYEFSFSPKYLLYTNTFLSILLCGSADFVQQNIEKYFSKKDRDYDFKRTWFMMIYGGVAAPISHFWYIALDRLVMKGSIHAIVAKKLLADQLICSPFFTIYFFLTISILQGQTVEKTKHEIKEKALGVYMVDCMVWPPVQAINFYLIPSHLRVIYIAVASFGWDIFLSYSKFKDSNIKEDYLSVAG